ncbi:hypothetical protein LRU_00265 [Ligilactobacillus ruminis SPM0211]|uniref:Uncharacterized protein n=1 Tax=Ligilactobacillus ruminis SPM0211 TaxID=1040964 RepID=F7QXY0_9LACO|nr:hypothetical protein LRU_00265 [Ligilactobacillus ruminis SPM0211]
MLNKLMIPTKAISNAIKIKNVNRILASSAYRSAASKDLPGRLRIATINLKYHVLRI